MSTSAYRIEKRDIDGRIWNSNATVPTFNFSNDVEVRNFLVARAVYDNLSENGGHFAIHTNSLKELFSEVEAGNLNPTIDVLSSLRADLEYAESLGTLLAEYEVF